MTDITVDLKSAEYDPKNTVYHLTYEATDSNDTLQIITRASRELWEKDRLTVSAWVHEQAEEQFKTR